MLLSSNNCQNIQNMRIMLKFLEKSIIYPLDYSNEKLEITVEILLNICLEIPIL